MIRRPLAWLAVSLLGAVLLAGCGSSATTSKSSSTPAATTTATTTTSGAGGTTTSTGATSGSGATAAATQRSIEACRQRVQSASTLSATSKSKLEGLCAKAASGNTPEVKKVVREICEEAVNRATLPASSKEQALATCRSRTK